MKATLIETRTISTPLPKVSLKQAVARIDTKSKPSSVKIVIDNKAEYLLQSEFCKLKKVDLTEKQQVEFLHVLHNLISGITGWTFEQIADLSVCMHLFSLAIKNSLIVKSVIASSIRLGQRMAMQQIGMQMESVLPSICKGLGILYSNIDTLIKMLTYKTRQTASIGGRHIRTPYSRVNKTLK